MDLKNDVAAAAAHYLGFPRDAARASGPVKYIGCVESDMAATAQGLRTPAEALGYAPEKLMSSRSGIRRAGVALAIVSFCSMLPLVAWQTRPDAFGSAMHSRLAAAPLVVVALCLMFHRLLRGAAPRDRARAALLAASFLFWAANVLWPDFAQATLFGDLAIIGFAIDVVLELLRDDGAVARRTRASPAFSPRMSDEG